MAPEGGLPSAGDQLGGGVTGVGPGIMATAVPAQMARPLSSEEESELSESEVESESEESGAEDTGSGDLKSTGQILWIRGLSRLQTQVCSTCAGLFQVQFVYLREACGFKILTSLFILRQYI